jgi:hypothetical protein
LLGRGGSIIDGLHAILHQFLRLVKLQLQGTTDLAGGLFDECVRIVEFQGKIIKLADHGFAGKVGLLLNGLLGAFQIFINCKACCLELFFETSGFLLKLHANVLSLRVELITHRIKALRRFLRDLLSLLEHLITGNTHSRFNAVFHGFRCTLNQIFHRLCCFGEHLFGLLH